MSPWLIGFVFFVGGPMIAAFVISTMRWNVLTPPEFIGFGNYLRALEPGSLTWHSIGVTFIYSIAAVPLMLVVAFAFATLLNKGVKGLPLFRTIFYLPSIVSGVAVALLWRWIYNPEFGLFNYLLSLVGIDGPRWLVDKETALLAIIFMNIWKAGGPMVIFLAGLQGIPQSLYEVADIDGATRVRKFFSVTLPMLSPVILFNLIIGIIASFQVFTEIEVMTEGGPSNATLVMVMHIYRNAFQYFDMGYGSALAVILFVIILAASVVQLLMSRRWVYYENYRGRF